MVNWRIPDSVQDADVHAIAVLGCVAVLHYAIVARFFHVFAVFSVLEHRYFRVLRYALESKKHAVICLNSYKFLSKTLSL